MFLIKVRRPNDGAILGAVKEPNEDGQWEHGIGSFALRYKDFDTTVKMSHRYHKHLRATRPELAETISLEVVPA